MLNAPDQIAVQAEDLNRAFGGKINKMDPAGPFAPPQLRPILKPRPTVVMGNLIRIRIYRYRFVFFGRPFGGIGRIRVGGVDQRRGLQRGQDLEVPVIESRHRHKIRLAGQQVVNDTLIMSESPPYLIHLIPERIGAQVLDRIGDYRPSFQVFTAPVATVRLKII